MALSGSRLEHACSGYQKVASNVRMVSCIVVLAMLAGVAPVMVSAQEFAPYPNERVTVAEWQAYYDLVAKNHGSARQAFPDQHLVIFQSAPAKIITSYAFTLEGHPAHPAWITRQLVEKDGAWSMSMIGYFAGNEASFAELFRAYQDLNARMTEDLRQKAR